MREIICVFRHEPVEKLFQVASRGRIGIFHDDNTATGVLNKNRHGSVSYAALIDLRLHAICDFVQAFSIGAHFELVVVDAHRGDVIQRRAKGKTSLRRVEAIVAHASRLRSLVMRKRRRVRYLRMQGDIERVLFDQPAIHKRLDEMAAQITADYCERELSVVALLAGSLMFVSDLLRRIPLSLNLDCLSVVSYHGKAQTSSEVIFKQDSFPDLADRDVLIVDDVLDTGHTLSAVREKLERAKPRSIRVAVLLSKKKQRAREVDVDYVGFEIEDEFVVGYGLDFMEGYRNLPYIGVLRKELLEPTS